MDDAARDLILDFALDELALCNLTMGMRVLPRNGEEFEAHPPMSVERLRSVLEALLRGGQVEVHRVTHPGSRALSLDDALTLAAGDTAWAAPGEPDWALYELALTPLGDAEHRAICDA